MCPVNKNGLASRSSNLALQKLLALYRAFQHIALFHRPNARRRAGEDVIAGLELEEPGCVADHFVETVDHERAVPLLDNLSV